MCYDGSDKYVRVESRLRTIQIKYSEKKREFMSCHGLTCLLRVTQIHEEFLSPKLNHLEILYNA